MIVGEYSAAFRSRMVERMVGPRAVSACALSREVGVAQPVLSRWLLKAPTVDGMIPSRKTTAKQWTGAEKWRVVLEASQCSASDLGALLRREGLHEAQVAAWRAAADAALAEPAKPSHARAKPSPEALRLQGFERELRRRDATLAGTAALLVLKKCYDLGYTTHDAGTDDAGPDRGGGDMGSAARRRATCGPGVHGRVAPRPRSPDVAACQRMRQRMR